MLTATKLAKLRTVITENLRVQKGGEHIEYINVGNALSDVCAKQNHTVFARRGSGKTLLLHHSRERLDEKVRAVYLNCEDFKKHSFPNVLIEILTSLFQELQRNSTGWFGKKKRLKDTLQAIVERLAEIQKQADNASHRVTTSAKQTKSSSSSFGVGAKAKLGPLSANIDAKQQDAEGSEHQVERQFEEHRDKIKDLDAWLPDLKRNVQLFFDDSSSVKAVFLQIDDLYHLKRADQAFVVDYIHRLCKDVPLYFKIATLRHASTLYADRDGQPIGAQERHDYQPINIDYTFNDFEKTKKQNREILIAFGKKAGLSSEDIDGLFKGEGFARLVMAGGGVPRDVLSLFLEILGAVDVMAGEKIGKDEVRNLSRENFERRIEELKQDSHGAEQDDLMKGIYTIRGFCLEKKTNIFVVKEQMMQTNDQWRALFNRLLDYRIIHSCASAITHKSQKDGTYQAFAVDIGCYAHLRKLQDRFNEIDVSDRDSKERMRSAPVLDANMLSDLFKSAPANVEQALRDADASLT